MFLVGRHLSQSPLHHGDKETRRKPWETGRCNYADLVAREEFGDNTMDSFYCLSPCLCVSVVKKHFYLAAGSSILNTVPLPTLLFTEILPP